MSPQSHFARVLSCTTIFLFTSLASAQSPSLSTDSVTPQNGSGSSQVFTFVFSDSAGYQNIDAHIIFGNAGQSGGAVCWMQVAPSGIQLAPDDLSGYWPGIAYGSNATLQNSQCAINGAATTASGSGNTLTVNISLTFRVAFAGMKTIQTNFNNSHDYESVGSYNVTPTAPDFTLGVSPSSQSIQAGQSTTYTVTAAPDNGFSGNITLSTNLPDGVTGSFNPSVIAGGGGSSTLTVTAASSAPSYNGSIVITGTSPSITHTATTQLTLTAAAPPPPPTLTTDSVTPQNGSGSSQVFTFVFSDSAGYQHIDADVIFANAGQSGGPLCWMQVAPSIIELAPDDFSGAWPGIAYGSNATLQNSQCAINGATTTASGSGNTLTVNISLTFRVAFAGMKTIQTNFNNSHDYESVGSYNVTATAPDFTLTVSPSSQSVQAGQSTTYTVTAAPDNGFSDNITLSTNLPDGVTGSFNPSVIAGGGGSSTLTVTAASSAPSYNGSIGITGRSSSVTHTATTQLTVTAAAPPPPPTLTTDSVTPQNGSGSSQVFTFVFSDSAGYQHIDADVIFANAGQSGGPLCWMQVAPSIIELAPDDFSGAWPGIAYGSNATLQNSQCAINGATTTASGSGNTLTVNISLTFRVAFAGMKTIQTNFNNSHDYESVGSYNVTATAPDFTLTVSPSSQSIQAGQSTTYTVTAAPDNGFSGNITLSTNLPDGVTGSFNPSVIAGGGGSSTLTVTAASSAPSYNGSIVITGTSPSITHTATTHLTVTGPPPPPPPTITTDSVAPQNGGGSSQVFTFQFSDSSGYSELLSDSKYHVLINAVPSGSGSCWILLLSTGVSLAPDNPDQTWTFVPYGSSATAQNSQCMVSGVGTNISGSGNSLSLSLALTFTPGFAGTKNVYTDINPSTPSYAAVTTYSVQ